MASILVDKLINAALARGADGLLLAAGYPPTLFLHDQMVDFKTQPLDQDDVMACARSLGLTLSNTEAEQTLNYRNTSLRVTTSNDRIIVRFRT